MPVYPVVFEPAALTGRYPHMSRRDLALWERYLASYAHQWQGFAYDVALGGLDVTGEDVTEAERLGWRFSTAHRIDVVANRGDEHWLIEVKPNARAGALGQAWASLVLAQREPWTSLPMVPAVLTDNVAPDIRYCAEQMAVELIVIPEPTSPGPVALG
jgi:hypothetical protein